MKKLFLLAVILIFTTACSPMKSLLGSSDNGSDSSTINNQLDEEFGGEDVSDILDDFEKQVKEDLEELDKKIEDQNMQDAIDDFEEQLQNDIDELDERIDEDNMQDAMDDFEEQLEKDLNKLDDKMDAKDDESDMQDAMDDFEANLEHEVNMLDEKIEDHFMKKITRDFEKQLEEDLMDGKPKEERRGGSCNMIAKTSTCLDYIGSFWTETQMKYSCSYSGTFSFDACETGSIGGCNVGKGSFNDMIIWMYPYGGAPISGDTVKSAKPACDMNPMGTWVNAR